MAFGGKPYTCPAIDNFGPKMIGLLVAALWKSLKEEWNPNLQRTTRLILDWQVESFWDDFRDEAQLQREGMLIIP